MFEGLFIVLWSLTLHELTRLYVDLQPSNDLLSLALVTSLHYVFSKWITGPYGEKSTWATWQAFLSCSRLLLNLHFVIECRESNQEDLIMCLVIVVFFIFYFNSFDYALSCIGTPAGERSRLLMPHTFGVHNSSYGSFEGRWIGSRLKGKREHCTKWEKFCEFDEFIMSYVKQASGSTYRDLEMEVHYALRRKEVEQIRQLRKVAHEAAVKREIVQSHRLSRRPHLTHKVPVQKQHKK